MSITEVEDLTMFCRVCLQIPEDQDILDLNLIYDEEEQLSYYECFTMCTQINLTDDDGLPQNLCRRCCLELQMAYDFYKKVEESKRFLAQLQDQHAEAAVATADSVSATTQECDPEDEEEVEEHLELEDYQAVEQLDDEENVEYVFIEETTTTSHPQEESVDLVEQTTAANAEAPFQETYYDDSQGSCTDESSGHASKGLLVPVHAKGPGHDKPQEHRKYRKTTTASGQATPVDCDICGKTFTNKSRMLYHRRIHDKNRTKYPCPEPDCKRVYATKQACDVHFKQTHLVEGLVCPVCNKIFIVPQSLEVHMRYHTGEFPYSCEVCGKRYGQKGHLTTHMQVKHNNLRYFCPEPGCMKVFKNSMSLRNHRFTHTEMPFRCSYCDKGYPQKSKLKAHVISKHNKNVSYDELESMRRFQESRTRYSFMKVHTEEESLDREEVAAVEEIVATDQ